MGKIKCPKCGSYNVSYTMLGCIERAGTYGAAIAGSLIVSSLTPSWMHTQTSSMIKKTIPSEYCCNRCHYKFHSKKEG
ncbi:hypothetical protein [uncultured Bacteroides sp.]|jgi:transposase-like protein|uniref:hypothetical protein n=1 Tax=uncultured Bacteroides sp. TaxID=162156 RepID=UPI00258B118E|nr:hypothetical protein [uncultured Bacteroides sp.]